MRVQFYMTMQMLEKMLNAIPVCKTVKLVGSSRETVIYYQVGDPMQHYAWLEGDAAAIFEFLHDHHLVNLKISKIEFR